MLKPHEIPSQRHKLDLENFTDIPPLIKHSLLEAGFTSIVDLVVRGPTDIAEAANFRIGETARGFKICQDICNKARAKLEEVGIIDRCFTSAEEIYNKKKQSDKVSTGSEELNEILRGGIETGAVTEIYGKKNAGISQLCYTLCMMVQEDIIRGGLKGKAVYIDSKNRFNARYVYSITLLRNFGRNLDNFDPYLILKNIFVLKPTNVNELEQIIQQVGHLIYENNIKLIVFDSLLFHYSREFYGVEALSQRQQKLNRLIHIIKLIAEIYDVAIIITNESRSSSQIDFQQEIHTVGGNILSHNSTYKISIRRYSRYRKNRYGQSAKRYSKYIRIAKIVNSPYHPIREAVFRISKNGIEDL